MSQLPEYAFSLIVFIICYGFIVREKVDKTIPAILGAGLLIATHQIGYEEALAQVDLNVIFLLIGMMMMVNLLATTGVFEWTAIKVAQLTGGNGPLILIALISVTALLSAFLDNVTTVILIAPITILIAQLLELPAVLFLILEAIASNIGGTGTLIGDPPNIIIGSQTGLTFNQFLLNLGPAALLVMVTLALGVFLFLRKRLSVNSEAISRLMLAEPAKAILNAKRLHRALIVLGLVFTAFFLGHYLKLETGIIALMGGFGMMLVCHESIHHSLEKVEWPTILFFVGLFMLVGALEANGLFEILGDQLILHTKGNLFLTAIAILWVSAIFSAFLDNIPLVISLMPVLATVIPQFAAAQNLDPASAEVARTIAEPLYWSLALGACLGGNGTLIGASANVVISQIARKNGYKLEFVDFFRLGFPIMLVSVCICTVYIWLRYFL